MACKSRIWFVSVTVALGVVACAPEVPPDSPQARPQRPMDQRTYYRLKSAVYSGNPSKNDISDLVRIARSRTIAKHQARLLLLMAIEKGDFAAQPLIDILVDLPLGANSDEVYLTWKELCGVTKVEMVSEILRGLKSVVQGPIDHSRLSKEEAEFLDDVTYGTDSSELLLGCLKMRNRSLKGEERMRLDEAIAKAAQSGGKTEEAYWKAIRRF